MDITAKIAAEGAGLDAGRLREWLRVGPAPAIVDLRDGSSFARERIPGARLLGRCTVHRSPLDRSNGGTGERSNGERARQPRSDALLEDAETLLRSDGLVVLVCEDGGRSRAAVETARARGGLQFKYLEGGMAAWRAGNRARRAHVRIVPVDCVLQLRREGLMGWLAGNLCAQWLDVSEGGLGALVSRELRVGERLRVRLLHPDGYGAALAGTVRVQHVRAAKSRPGSYVIGAEFVAPSRMLSMCLRALVDTGSLPARGMVAAYVRAG